jgi:hypothetical protein
VSFGLDETMNAKAKQKKLVALRRYRRDASEAYERARIAKELGSHGGASDVRRIDPATGQQMQTMPKRKKRSERGREQSRRIGLVPSPNG